MNHMPDSGHEHAADGNDGFLVATAGFQSSITDQKFGTVFFADHSVGDLDEQRFQIAAGLRDPGAFHMTGTLVVAGADAGPGTEVLGSRKHRHIASDF